jgi:peptidyl-prolyl cis-trans isomerase B (cyclophilin B)
VTIEEGYDSGWSRRDLILSAGFVAAAYLSLSAPSPATAAATEDLEAEAPAPVSSVVGTRVYFDLALCPDIYKAERTLGDKTILCDEPAPLGRVVLGLYSEALPQTTENFASCVRTGLYNGTIFSRIFQGEFVQGGVQGSRRLGLADIKNTPGLSLGGNPEVLDPRAFSRRHVRPGTLSLALSENIDDPVLRDLPG